MVEKLTEEWLARVGFKWHQFDRQPNKHWLLWLGSAAGQGRSVATEDVGIEIADMRYENSAGERVGTNAWFCWLRADTSGRYHRFIHMRHVETQDDVVALVEAISGQKWNPENHRYGAVLTPEAAARDRRRDLDLDRRMMREGNPWSVIEKDDTRGRALPEHLEAHEKQKP